MKIERFEDIIAWKKAKELCQLLFLTFGESKDYVFKDQILRASLSIMNNIAEGFERYSNKDFKNFLFIAKGSAGEVRSMLYVAEDRKMVNDMQLAKTMTLASEISRLLGAFIKTL